jgi:mRNA-degrading endonuclease toxin of MazEF toxin-antitoxin module
VKGFRFEVPIATSPAVTGVVLADRVRCLSCIERRAELIGTAHSEVVNEVREKLAVLIGIE